MVNHRHFEPGSARTQNWDLGYEETVLREAAEEMNELDAAMKEVCLYSKYSKNTCREDNTTCTCNQTH